MSFSNKLWKFKWGDVLGTQVSGLSWGFPTQPGRLGEIKPGPVFGKGY